MRLLFSILVLLAAAPAVGDAVRTLPPSTADDLAALSQWNRARRVPTQSAIRRSLEEPIAIDLDRGGWIGTIVVRDAHAVSLHLTAVDLPLDARIFVRSERDEIGPIEAGRLLQGKEIWTPAVRGEEITLFVEAARGGFRIDSVLEWFELDERSLPLRRESSRVLSHVDCTVDATCISAGTLPNIDSYRKAVAQIQIIRSPGGSLCTGALIHDTDSQDPAWYFLTANHCVSTQFDATRATFIWEYRSAACNAGGGAFTSRTFGATLIATSPQSDATLLRLNEAPPPGSTALTWNPSPIPAGTDLYRISHPGGDFQKYSTTTTVTTIPTWCSPLPFPNLIFSQPTEGRITGGSSGAPVITHDGAIIGQLYGTCSDDDGWDLCTYNTYYNLDGAFSASYPAFAPWLAPPPCPTPILVSEPVGETVTEGQNVTLLVNPSRRAPFTYQWYRGARGDTNAPVASGTNVSLNVTASLGTSAYWVRVANSCGFTDSLAASVTGLPRCDPPVVMQQPLSQTVSAGTSVTLALEAIGNQPLTYQWYRIVQGVQQAIAGATSNRYTTPPLTETSSFYALIQNSCGGVSTVPATITVTATCTAPSLSAMPNEVRVRSGERATLTIQATGTGPLTYQWYKDAQLLAGATSTTLLTDQLFAPASFHVIVKNPCGELQSGTVAISIEARRKRPSRRR